MLSDGGDRCPLTRQYHRADQNLVCHGCQGVFKTASGLVRHIETDECPAISKIRLLREQTRKMCIKEALSGGRGENLPVIPSPRNPDDINGGVKLGGIAKNNREAMLNRPKLGEDDPTASVDSMLALKHWPRAGQDPAPAKGSMSDLMDFDPEDNPGPKGNGKAEASPGPEEQQQVVQCGPFGMNFLPDAGQTLRMIQRNWDATTFFNSFNGRYICPGCGGGFADKNTFEEHTLIESHDSMPGFQ